jgi:predicted phosphodiesterase
VLVVCWTSLAFGESFVKKPYLQNVSQTSITIMWQSRIGHAGTLTLHTSPERVFETDTEPMREVRINGLEPNTRYRFTVESNGERHEGEFATAPSSGMPFSFVVFGDSRSNASAHTRVIERIRQEVPDFLLGTGDIVNEGGSESDWSKLFEIEGALLGEVPFFPSLGNHDRQGRGRTAGNFRKYFAVPENSPDPERYYAFTYSSSRFLVLDSNTYSFALTDQTAWLEGQLQAARLNPAIEHIFVTMHHPPFSVSMHGGQSELREAWTPLFEKYQVDAVFSGHDHVYSRAKKNGVNYFVSGGGGAPLYGRKKNSKRIDVEATQFFERVNHHLRVQVVGDHVEIAAVRADGTLIETISWGRFPGADHKWQVDLAADRVPRLSANNRSLPELRGVGEGDSYGESEVTVPKQRKHRGFGLLGILGTVMTLSAAVVMAWAWRYSASRLGVGFTNPIRSSCAGSLRTNRREGRLEKPAGESAAREFYPPWVACS